MMKALKMGLFGLALGAMGAVVLPSQASADDCLIRKLQCSMVSQSCVNRAGGDLVKVLQCKMAEQQCIASVKCPNS